MYEFIDCICWLWNTDRQAYVICALIGMFICVFCMGVVIGDMLGQRFDQRERIRKGRYYIPDESDRWIIRHFSNKELGNLRKKFDEIGLPNNAFVQYLAYVAVRKGKIKEE